MAIQPRQRAGWCPSRTTLALLGVLAVATVLLLAGHTDHIIAALPFLLILACPLMHLFMMHGLPRWQGTFPGFAWTMRGVLLGLLELIVFMFVASAVYLGIY